MLSQWKLPLFKGLAVAMLLKMAINSFLSHYAEGLFVLFCSILRERDRNPSSCCRPAVPPSQNYRSSAAHQPTSAQGKAAVKLTHGSAASASSQRNGRGTGQRSSTGCVNMWPPGPRSPLSSAAGPGWTCRHGGHHGRQAGHRRCPMLWAPRVGPLSSCQPSVLAVSPLVWQ